MATHGTFVSVGVAYKVPDGLGPFDAVPCLGCGADKDRADFRNSERYTLGTAWTL